MLTGGSRRVVVTGMGMVTPLGVGVQTTWNNYIAGKTGVTETTRYSRPGDGEFEDYQRIGCKVAAFVPKGKDPGQFHPSLFFSERERPAMSQSSMFSCVAAEEALGDAEWTSRGMNERELSRTGISLGTAGFDGTDCMRQIEVFKENPLDLYPQTVLRFIGSMVAGLVGIRSGFRGPLSSLSTACATGTQSVMEGCRLIQEDRADVMICGSAESLATPLSLALFSVSGAVCTKYSDSPESASRPFDADRAGLVMGEGAGVLILEELEHALRRGAPRIYGEIVGCGMSSDAHHVTTPRPDVSGSLSAMTAALEGHNLEDVWMVDAHATSTKKGDIAEAKALARLLEPLAETERPHVAAAKGQIGHLMGGAGAVECGLALLCMKNNQLPGIANLTTMEEGVRDCNLRLSSERKEDDLHSWEGRRRLILKNSFAFGGINACLTMAELNERKDAAAARN